MDQSHELADRVCRLIANQCGVPLRAIRLSSRIEEDFGVTGDDASELLVAFANEFKVDLSNLDFHNHFGPEGCNPLWLIRAPDWLKEHGNFPVTVDQRVRVAQVGHWYSPPRIKTK